MILITILSLLLSGTTFFVSLEGDDDNSGTSPEQAWQTLEHVSNPSFSPGDQILFRAGDEFIGQLAVNSSGAEGNPIVFGRYEEGDKPIINSAPTPGGSYIASVLIRNQSFIELENLEITNDRQDEERAGEDPEQGYGIFVHNDGYELNGSGAMEHFHFRNLKVRDVYAYSTEGVDFDDLQSAGIYFRTERTTSAPAKRIKDVIVEDSFITLTGKFGIWSQHFGADEGFGGPRLNRNENLIFRNNHTYHTGGSGITPGSSFNVLMEGNRFEFPGSGIDPRMANRGSGAWFFNGRNIIAQHNEVISARGEGDTYSIHIDHGNENVFVQFNYSEDSEGGFAEILGNNVNSVYRYNVSVNDGFRNNARSMWVSDFAGNDNRVRSDNNYIYNNTIYLSEERDTGLSFKGNNTFVYNNIIMAAPGSSIGDIEYEVDITEGDFIVSNNLYDGNIWQDFINLDPNAVTEDPLFANAGGTDTAGYVLQSGSPARNAGIAFDQPEFPKAGVGIFADIPAYPEVDLYGNPIFWQEGYVNIGAYAQTDTPTFEVTGRFQTENVNLNPDATFDINEPIVGVEVKLFDGSTEIDSDVTNVDGEYTLEHSVSSGTLSIVFEGTNALQARTLEDIPAGEGHDEGAQILNWVEGTLEYNDVTYRTVTIGNQVWMAENLRTNSYSNGDPIPHVTENSEWGELSTGAFAVHANDDLDSPKAFNRGFLYNWFAVDDERGLCPAGWSVPSDEDFKALEEELGMSAADLDELGGAWRGADAGVSNSLRATGGGGDFFWRPDNTAEPAATNSTGFSMRGTSLRFAGGAFGQGDGDFSGLGEIGMLWSSTESPNESDEAIRRIIRSNQAGVRRNAVEKESGLAVRCIQGESAPQTYNVEGTIQTENVNLNPDATFNINEPLPNITVRLFNGEIELDSDVTDIDGAYTLEHSVDEDSLRIEVTGPDAFQALELTGIPTGEDHNVGPRNLFFKEGSVFYQGVRYRTVKIGDQVWMAENLRTDRYRNGDSIPNVTDNSAWSELSTGAFAVHANDDEDSAKAYNRGFLYNWFAVDDERGLCPAGWAVPSDDDFKEMEQFLGMPEGVSDNTGFDRGRALGIGNKLRSTSGLDNNFYLHPRNMNESPNNSSATNETGFSARGTSIRFAGGDFGDPSNDFEGLGRVTHLWTSTEDSETNAFRRVLTVADGGINRNSPPKELGLAVRCIKVEDDVATSLDFSDSHGPGWRMMSIPMYGITVSDLAAQNEVAGVPGANDFYNVDNLEDNVDPNLYLFDPSGYDSGDSDPTGWFTPENFETEFAVGNGFIWYYFDNDVSQSVPLDEFTLSLTGIVPTEDVTVPITSGTWNLVGNPFASNIDASQLSGDGLHSAAGQIWDSSAGSDGSFVVVEFNGENAGENTIATWQGFFIESDDAESFTIPESARTEDDATFYKKGTEAKIAFTLTGVDANSESVTVDRAISLVLDDQTSHDWDQRDIRKITPLSSQYATLAFAGMRGGEEILKAQESRPASFDETLELPMILNLSNIAGSFTLEWDGIANIPSELSVVLTDLETGETVDLRDAGSYGFEAGMEEELNEERFMLTLNNDGSSTPGSELPEEVSLSQNYPNPFNPTTTIEYGLPENGHVTLQVFDMLGRQVATLVDGQISAGTHQVTFDASSLSSGVYIYRLQAGEHVLTKKLTLIK